MSPQVLIETIAQALANLNIELGEQVIEVAPPKDLKFGDYATNIAMKLAKPLGSNPRELATKIAQQLEQDGSVEKAEVAGPGFINITVSKASNAEIVNTILKQGNQFGRGEVKAEKINLEYVSANPTGPLHIGHIRWAAVGSILGNLLRFSGYEVTNEYYFNDFGVQIDKFANSLLAAKGVIPSDPEHYKGDYIGKIAEQIDSTDYEVVKKQGVNLMMNEIKQELEQFKVHFDVFFNESALYPDSTAEALEKLEKLGMTYTKDNALWFKSSELGDEKDRVITKSDGNNAYFASDIAYYWNKRNRGFDRCVYMLGADHHGYIGRLKALSKAFGDTDSNLEILIGQLVNVKSGDTGAEKLSKRKGNMIFLSELIDLIGVDATRYSLGRANINRQITLDIDLLSKMSSDNPVFYVKYVHARCSAVIRKAKEQGYDYSEFDPGQLTSPYESDILTHLSLFPSVVEEATIKYEQYKIPQYVEELATKYHKWYSECSIMPKSGATPGPDVGTSVGAELEPVYKARLNLNLAVKTVIKTALEEIVGIEAPERM
jgi:arginyl-tRNA synthetase